MVNSSDERHADGIRTRHGERSERAAASEEDATEASEEEPRADQEHRPGHAAAGGEYTEAEDDLPEAGKHPEDAGRDMQQHERQDGARDSGGKELCNCHSDHLVGHTGVQVAGPGEHLSGYERSANDGRGEPEGDIRRWVRSWIRKPAGLGGTGEQCGDRRRRKSCRAIATKLGSLCHLAANVAYVGQCLVEFGHMLDSLCTAKQAYALRCKV